MRNPLHSCGHLTLLSIVAVCIVHATIGFSFTTRFTKLYESPVGEPTDAVRHIELANEHREGRFTLIPHFYSRSLIYHITGITSFPPRPWQLFCYQLVNSLTMLLLIIGIVRTINYSRKQLSLTQQYIISGFYFFSPGVLFLSATMRSEVFSFLLIWMTLLAMQCTKSQNRIALVFFSSFLGLLSRPTGVFFPWLGLITRRTSVGLTFVVLCICCSLILAITSVAFSDFFRGPHYLYTTYSDPLRDVVNIHSAYELWRVPLKIIVSLFLDAFSFSIWSQAGEDPELLNNIAASVRVGILVVVLGAWFSGYLGREARALLSLYFCYVIPLICFSGFYQTRYFIPADLFLFAIIILLVTQHGRVPRMTIASPL